MEVQRTSDDNATVARATWWQWRWRGRLQGERREKWSCGEKWRVRRGRRKRKKKVRILARVVCHPRPNMWVFGFDYPQSRHMLAFGIDFFINRSIKSFLASGVLWTEA